MEHEHIFREEAGRSIRGRAIMHRVMRDKGVEARKNMRECQLATSGIVTPAILDAFGKIPRELFLPESCAAAAYCDDDIALPGGAVMMEPLAHARMVQAAAPHSGDAVLNIGDMTGYSSAIFSELVSTVVTLESRIGILDRARRVWDDLGCCNIAVVRGRDPAGSPEHAPYDVIFINGAVADIPAGLLDQLACGGRLVAVVKKLGSAVGGIVVTQKAADGVFSTLNVHDTAVPYVPGFEPAETFIF